MDKIQDSNDQQKNKSQQISNQDIWYKLCQIYSILLIIYVE